MAPLAATVLEARRFQVSDQFPESFEAFILLHLHVSQNASTIVRSQWGRFSYQSGCELLTTNPDDKPRRSIFQLPSAPATPLSTLRAKLTRDTMGRRAHFHEPKSPAEVVDRGGGAGSDPFSGVKFACDAGLPAVENKTTASLDRTCRRPKLSTARLEQVQRDTCCSIAAT